MPRRLDILVEIRGDGLFPDEQGILYDPAQGRDVWAIARTMRLEPTRVYLEASFDGGVTWHGRPLNHRHPYTIAPGKPLTSITIHLSTRLRLRVEDFDFKRNLPLEVVFEQR